MFTVLIFYCLSKKSLPMLYSNLLLIKTLWTYYICMNICIYIVILIFSSKMNIPSATVEPISGKPKVRSVPKFTANLYCICLSLDLWYILKQMQYRFAVNFGTLSKCARNIFWVTLYIVPLVHTLVHAVSIYTVVHSIQNSSESEIEKSLFLMYISSVIVHWNKCTELNFKEKPAESSRNQVKFYQIIQ